LLREQLLKALDTLEGKIMLSVSVKLTLRVLVLPILSISVLFLTGFYFYRANLDASSFFTAISSLLSAILVILLVWERLRDSCQKKLEWIHDNIFFKLYQIFKEERPYFWYKEVIELTEDLRRYGKFLRIDLCPKNIVNDISECIDYEVIFDTNLKKIQESAEKLGLTDWNMLYQFLDIDPYRSKSAFNPDDPNIPKYREGASLIQKENQEAVNKIKELDKEIMVMKKKIALKLELFMKNNALRLKEEPSYHPFYR